MCHLSGLVPNSPTSWLVSVLTAFRRHLEQELDEPLETLELPVILLLDDLCRWFDLSGPDRLAVLGPGGAAMLEQLLETSVSLVEPQVPVAV